MKEQLGWGARLPSPLPATHSAKGQCPTGGRQSRQLQFVIQKGVGIHIPGVGGRELWGPCAEPAPVTRE